MAATFGIDFGTTNSLITVISTGILATKKRPYVLTHEGKPHPSVVWYGGTVPVAGKEAKDHLSQLGLGVFGNFVRSPKIFLGSPYGISVGGIKKEASDVVADLLGFLRKEAKSSSFKGNSFESAVITIPVTMRGPARAELRFAAQKAGIRIHQFVHEPLAALYGYLRRGTNFGQTIADLERRLVLVFDWGGGTLDLTLCQVQNGLLMQIANLGDTEVGGDAFDLRLRNLIRRKHEENFPNSDWSLVQPNADARLLQACEDLKIGLSEHSKRSLFISDYLATPGPEKDIYAEISRAEFEELVTDLIIKGIENIRNLLEIAGINREAIEFCLATGGMVAMPAIKGSLREIFGMNRLKMPESAATLISEGAAWIAHDEARLQTAKAIEVLNAGNTFVEIIPSGVNLPFAEESIEKSVDMYCVDPTDGYAKFLFARPKWPGKNAHGDERIPYSLLSLNVDSHSKPFFERLHVKVRIDENLIAEIRALSLMRGEKKEAQIHDLEFGLKLRGSD